MCVCVNVLVYRDLGSVELAINDGALHNLECLRLNENMLTRWPTVFSLTARHFFFYDGRIIIFSTDWPLCFLCAMW